ncbi:unnamed protein product [Nezara viridula]|uniref:MADF domain-containing protein n=1 Tax=Nezara viridula TaxID=85310 RepID=A0A9P0E7R5_NEZVI|nr:unnamed protein product [Nezara viridula]
MYRMLLSCFVTIAMKCLLDLFSVPIIDIKEEEISDMYYNEPIQVKQEEEFIVPDEDGPIQMKQEGESIVPDEDTRGPVYQTKEIKPYDLESMSNIKLKECVTSNKAENPHLVKRFKTEDLIKIIEKHKVIWDSGLEQYSNKNLKMDAWNQVMLHFLPDFEEKDEAIKNAVVTIVQKKWKGIRACYSRELRRKRNLSGASTAMRIKPYLYFEQLRFLETNSKKMTYSVEDEPNSTCNEDNEEVTGVSSSMEFSKSNRLCEDDELKEKKLKSDPELMDEDRHFLLSLVSEIKKVPAENKLKLRTEIIRAIAAAQGQSLTWPPVPFGRGISSGPPFHSGASLPMSGHGDPLQNQFYSQLQNYQTNNPTSPNSETQAVGSPAESEITETSDV